MRIGDVLSSRYQVVGKLGFGNSSTVWLARDLQAHRHVALKIFTNDGQNTNEIAIYKHIGQGNKSRLGYRYVRTALDSFELMNRGGKPLFLLLLRRPRLLNPHRARKRWIEKYMFPGL
ncbi:hypothetical protein OCU04_010063 [Sclerotinia nivalis]|uniref:non-specific serine/threonine protein kinase n=1 Tax=Sclerotinia nivalis TaxID=352851 RepID=A0A9X0ADY0_9HELO|nr:hypothetical protein OCU04_010063 [Sclerotinia nivalis]